MSEFENEVTEGAAETPEVPATEAPAASPWAPPQEEWGQITQFVSQSAPILQQLAELVNADPNEGAEPSFEDYDPFDPESVQRMIDARAQAIADAQLSPFKGLLGMLSQREGEALARAELERITGEVGEFDKDTAFMVASGLIDQGMDPAQALRQGATYTKEFESRVRQDERTKVEQELRARGEAPHEPPVGTTTGEPGQPVPTGPGRYEEAIQRAMSRMRPSVPAG